jgi:hypothetical protein
MTDTTVTSEQIQKVSETIIPDTDTVFFCVKYVEDGKQHHLSTPNIHFFITIMKTLEGKKFEARKCTGGFDTIVFKMTPLPRDYFGEGVREEPVVEVRTPNNTPKQQGLTKEEQKLLSLLQAKAAK